jgi:hypothetical protein
MCSEEAKLYTRPAHDVVLNYILRLYDNLENNLNIELLKNSKNIM